MKKVLVTYATLSGSTAETAQVIAETLEASGLQAEVLPLEQAKDPGQYAAVFLGAPMILGWHREALRYLKAHQEALQQVPLRVFVTAMSLTAGGETEVDGVAVFVDEGLAKPPNNPPRLSFKERYARVANYARPILKAAGPARPTSIAFFGGRLDMFRLKWWAILFVLLIIRIKPGDLRNKPAMRTWAQQAAQQLTAG